MASSNTCLEGATTIFNNWDPSNIRRRSRAWDACTWGDPYDLRWILRRRVYCLSAQEVHTFGDVGRSTSGG